MRAYERFLEYVRIHTTSEEGTGRTPSTPRQLVLANLLAEELRGFGAADAHVDEWGYVYGSLPATGGCEGAPALGWIAHMDTAPDFSGENVNPILHENYDGGDIPLPTCGRVLRTAEFPFLTQKKGQTLITADGSTLLGADDKAGIAEILTACERLIADGLPHGPLKIAFTPDEEIGEGPAHFDVQGFGAQFAYTVDGGAVGGISYENFNAASAVFDITGVAVHPGSAKDMMVNALKLACEIDGMLPPLETPAHTEGRDGFFHLTKLEGSAAHARCAYLIRDFDRDSFEARKRRMSAIEKQIAEKYPTAKVKLTVEDSYYNMEERIRPCLHLVENAQAASRAAGVEPRVGVTRGGTDGARLSFMGLPCPNLGTGGYNGHGPYECISVEDMDKATEIVLDIIDRYAHF